MSISFRINLTISFQIMLRLDSFIKKLVKTRWFHKVSHIFFEVNDLYTIGKDYSISK